LHSPTVSPEDNIFEPEVKRTDRRPMTNDRRQTTDETRRGIPGMRVCGRMRGNAASIKRSANLF
jgi:hypothetical protein